MTDARAFRGFRFPAEMILWAVRWYLQFQLSYRALERMLADRGTCSKPQPRPGPIRRRSVTAELARRSA